MNETEIYALTISAMQEMPGLARHPDQSVAEHIRVNAAQGLSAARHDVTCCRCGRTTACVRWTDPSGQLADTWGYMEFGDPGDVCSACLGESYTGELWSSP